MIINEFKTEKEFFEIYPKKLHWYLKDIFNDFISFCYQRHEDDFFFVEKIHIFEFMARLTRHIPDGQLKMIRYYGFYASRKHKL